MTSDTSVASSVSSIVSAFASGLDILKKIRNRRRKKKANARTARSHDLSQDEMRLNASLRRGSRDVQREYEKSYQALGKYFARGDAAAHASLAETLLRLNSGLVRIISSFLARGKGELGAECKSLTALSNSSRVETLDALNQLYHRLAGSALDLRACNVCQNCSNTNTTQREYRKPRQSTTPSGRAPARRSKEDDRTIQGPTVARLAVEGSRNTQLAMVRPRNRRTTSACSASSASTSKSFSTATTAVSTPPASPGGLSCGCHGSIDPHAHPPPIPPKQIQNLRLNPAGAMERPQTWPNRLEPQARVPPCSTGSTLPTRNPQVGAPAAREDFRIRRRAVETPSTYSFASDSTKLGEIPMHKWTKPFDFAEMERLNSLSEKMESVGISNDQPKDGGRKKGLWKLFKGKAQPE